MLLTINNLIILFFFSTIERTDAILLFTSSFQTTNEGFIFQNDMNSVTTSFYVTESLVSGDGNNGYLQIGLGGYDNLVINNMSGRWYRNFTLPERSNVEIRVNYEVFMSPRYEIDEFTQAFCSVNGVLVGSRPDINYIGQTNGTRPGIPFNWVKLNNIILEAGTHVLAVGAYNNKKTFNDESSRVRFSDISLDYFPINAPVAAAGPTKVPVNVPTKSTTTAPTKMPSNTLPGVAIRINVGSNNNYTDPNGQNWIADTYYGNKGGIFNRCPLVIANTTMGELYCKERFFNKWQSPQPFLYDIPVPRPAAYTVRLHFAEIYHSSTGARVFDVWVNGILTMAGLDIFAQVGYGTALIVSVVATVPGNFLKVEFVPKQDNPKLAGIEIIEVSNNGPSPAPTRAPTAAPIATRLPSKAPSSVSVPLPTNVLPEATIRINAGSIENYTDPNGIQWIADAYFGNNGATFTRCPLDISGTTMDALYCKERYFNKWQSPQPFVYNIPVPRPAVYTVRLHFAEIYHTAIGARVFGVWVNNQLLIGSLDIFAEVGHATALVVPATTTVLGSSLKVELIPVQDNPKICGIEVIEINDITPTTLAPISAPAPVTPMTAAPLTSPAPVAVTVVPLAPMAAPMVVAPIPAPMVVAPIPAPMVVAPIPAPVAAPLNYLINCGGTGFLENSGERYWGPDQYFVGGSTYSNTGNDIMGTVDDILYQSERYGEFKYEIPVPTGSYDVILHFAELYWEYTRQRLFSIKIENDLVFRNIDIVALAGGERFHSFTLAAPVIVSDGFISIELLNSDPKVDNPKISGIEINFLQPHLAHSVSNGPYIATDVFNVGFATVVVDGTFSHSHGTGLDVIDWVWKDGAVVVGVGPTPNITLPVGVHTITLSIKDSDNNEATDTTTITVQPYGYPAVLSIEPSSGAIAGGQLVTIKGSGFTFAASATKVKFGLIELSGNSISIIDQYTITLRTPVSVIGSPVSVSVETPLSTSNDVTYTYEASSPIAFTSEALAITIAEPTSVGFGQDGRLYVGTLYGSLHRLTLDDSFTTVISSVSRRVAPYRAILGIAFNPLQTEGFSDVYITTSFFFHQDSVSSGGNSINGNVKKISGANLDVIVDIVTGLPVSDHDHGLTGLEYGDNGEIYIQCASNTNAGIPGKLTGKHIQKDNYYSSATVVANLADPLFNGSITYNATDDGVPIGGYGIDIFAAGTRNPWGICLHSNGNIYSSDNGPNVGYGAMMLGCNGEFQPDLTEGDKINLLRRGGYYGMPNRIRALATGDTRQCKWHSQFEASNNGYTAPILNTQSSTDGLVEFQSDHFDKQLRGNLIAAKYQGSLYRIVLTPDGNGVIPQSNPMIELTPDVDALDVVQAPDGTLISTSLDRNAIYYHKPIEQPTTQLKVYSVFPRRGGQSGGNVLQIYGTNFNNDDIMNPIRIMVGGRVCSLLSFTNVKMTCTMPGGTGTVDIVVTGSNGQTYNFERGYRYVTGLPQ